MAYAIAMVLFSLGMSLLAVGVVAGVTFASGAAVEERGSLARLAQLVRP